MKNKLLTKLVLSSMALGLAVNQGRANPLGGTVAAGDATIAGEGTAVTTIHQTSPTAIINWQDFSIGLGELTRFIQPGADAAVLNRVLSGSPSQLLGTLQANGQVYLINPNGIFVGPSGQINAATFVGSTLDVADGAFLSGGNMQFLGSTTAGVENLGTINALGGDIFLFGHTVKNSGTLNASGTAGLAAGMSIELRQQGNERIGVLLGNSAAPTETGVDNQGLVQATSVEINAAGGNIYAVAINNGGTVRAQPTLTMEGGKLVLKSVGGTVINSGTLDASNADGKGGDIVVSGDKVSLRDGSLVNASGSTGGGSVKIGGGFLGNDASVVNASKTFVGTGASILADATTVGDGGTVIVWSDEVTRFGGSISAKGGALGGNGGFAEVSGKSLLFSGMVDLTAAAGEIGTLLLDPVQIQIAATDFNPVASNDEFAENAGLPAVFANTTINALLNGANVTLQANSDIYIDNAINAAGIGDLTLQAGRSVFINADVTLNGSFTATANDTAALAANRATTPFADGGITMGGTVTINTSSTGGNITLNVLTGAGGGFQSGDITVNNLNAGAGHVFLNNAGATAGSDVLMANGTALITAGSVALNAANGNVGSGATPVRIASTIVEAAASGTVDIFATGALQIGGATLGSLTGITSGGALHVTAQGNITQTELITASAASTFTIDTANPADVLLASAANNFAGAITVNEANAGVVRDIAIRNVNASPAYPTFTIAGTIRNLTLIFDSADLTLPTTTITGNLVATSGTGLIAQSGTLTVPGTTTLNASTTITLNDAANDFTGAVASTSGGNTSLTDANAIVLGASSVGGNLVVNAGTGITQTGVLTVTGTSSFTDAAGNDDIVITQANLFTGAVSASGNNVSITDANGLILGNVTVGGDLTVLASAGDITTDAASTGIIVTGNSSFTANGAGASILLGDADNNFTGNVSIAGSGGLANVTIFDATALVLNSVTITGNLTATATGLTQSGVITVGGTTTLNGGAAAINLATQNNDFNTVTASNTSDLSLNDINDIVLGAITLTGNLTVNSGLTGAGVTGNISQTGVLDIDGTSAFNVSAANLSDVLLASQANEFTGAVTITEVGAGNIRDIELRNISGTAAVPVFPTGLRNLTLIFNNAAIDLSATTLTGTLTVTAGGAITDNGALVVAGTTTLTAGAANNITLDTAGNDFNTVSVVSGNNVTLVDVDDIDFGASTISGTLSVTANGAITDSGNVTVAGATTTLFAGPGNIITLDSSGNDFNTVLVTIANNVTLVDTDNIDFGASTILGSLNVTAGGAITDSGTVNVIGGTTTLAAGTANNITLDQAGNNFNTVVITSGNDVTLVDGNSIDLGASTVTGTLNVTAAGNITDSGNVTVGGTTTLSAGAVITLDQAGNDFNTVVITTGNNVTLVDTDNLDLGASTVTGTLNVTANGAITDSGNVTVTGTTTLAAGAANDITLNSAGNDFNTVVITTGNNVTLVDTDDIDLGASTISGTLSVSASGTVTDSGNVTVAGATATIAAGAANNITLDSAGNDFNTVVITTGNNVTLVDTDNIDLGASTISGTLSVTASGAITDSGNVTVAGATATFAAGGANDITLNSAGNDFNTVLITTGNNVTLVDTDNLDLGASTISGTLSVTAGGAITDSGTVTVAGSTTLTAGAFDITLNDAANDFNAVTVVSGANVTIVDVDDITFSASATLTSAAITGTAITLPAGITTSGAQTYTGAVLIGSDMTIQSTGGGNLSFTSTINSTTGNSFDLALITDGAVTIGNAVGGTDHLDVLDIRADAITFTAITTDTSVTLRPFTAGTTIGLEDATQTFNITDAELDNITSPLVTIGDSTAGAITVADDANVTLGYSITLVNNSSVTFDPNSVGRTFSTTGGLTVNANGAITDGSGVTISVTGLASFNAGAANSITLGDNGGDTIGFGTLTVVGNNVTITEDNAMNFAGTSTIAGNLVVTTQAGDITQNASSSISVTGNAKFAATANISIGENASTTASFGTLTFTGVNANIYETGDMLLSGVSSVSQVFNLQSFGGSIADDATASTTATLVASFIATGDIIIGDTGTDVFNAGSLAFQKNGAGSVSITENSSTDIVGAFTSFSGGSLTINSAGDITDGAGATISVDGNATFNANSGASNITLGDNGGDNINFGSLTVAGNNVTITEDSSTLLTGVNTVNGFLTLTSASDITDASGVTLNVTGLATFDATAGNITLGDNGAADTIHFGTLTFNTTGGAVSITEDSSMSLTGINTADSVTLSANGFIQDVSGTSLTVDVGDANFTGTFILLADDNETYNITGTAVFNGGSGIVSVGQGATATTTFGKLTFNSSAAAVTITEDNDTLLTGTSTGDSLVLVSSGTITDDSGTSVTIDNGNATFTGTAITLADNDGDTLSVSGLATFNGGAGVVNIGQGSTATANFGTLTFVTTGAVAISEDTSMDIVGVNTAGSADLDSTAGITDATATSVTVTGLTDVNGTSISLGGGTFDSGTLTFNSAGAVVISEDSGMNIVGVNTAGSADLDSTAGISDAGATSVTVTGLTDVNGTSISLGGGTFDSGTLTFNSAGAVVISEDSGMNIVGVNTAASVDLDSTAGITDATATSVTVTGLTDVAGTSINLGGGTFNSGTLTFNSAGAVVISEDSGMNIVGVNTAGSADLDSTAGITDATATSVTVTGLTDVNGTSISLGGGTFDSGTLTFNSAGAVVISEDSGMNIVGVNTALSADLDSTGAITDATATSVDVTNLADVNGTSISLGGGTFNAGTLTFNSAGAVVISEDSGMNIVGVNTAGSADLDSTAGITDATATSVTVTGLTDVNGTSISLGGGTFDSGTLTFNSAGAVVIAEDSGMDIVGANTAGTLTLSAVGDMQDDDGSSSLTVTGNASFTTTGGGFIGFGGGGSTFDAGSVTFNSAASVFLFEDSNTDIVGVNTAAGAATIESTGAVSDAGATSVDVTGLLTVSGTSISLGGGTFNAGTLTFNSAGAVVISEDSGMNIVGVNTALSADLDSTGAITDATATSVDVTNLADVNGTSISLGGGTFNAGTLTFNSAGAVVISEDSGMNIVGVNTAASVDLDSTAGITDATATSVTVTGLTDVAGTSINLGGGTFNSGTLTFNSAGAVVIAEDSDTVLAGTSTANTLTLSSTATITDDTTVNLTVNNNASFTGTVITLDDTYNFGSVTLSGTVVTVVEASAMTVAGATATTSLTLSANGTVDQSTAIINTPTLSVTVTTAGPDDADILLNTQDNNVSGTVTFAEANADALRDVLWRNVSATATWPTLPATATINDLTVQHTMTGISITAALTLKDIAGDSGDLNLLAGAGSITQTAGSTLTIPGTTTLSATTDITLNLANDFDSPGLFANDGIVTILKGANVTLNDINNIIINASDATTGGTLTSLVVTANAGAGTIFIEDNDFGTAVAVTITTTASQTYNGNVVLNQDTVMNSTGAGTISFSGTINSDSGNNRSLEVNTAGLTQFAGANVGNIDALSSLTTDSVASGILGGNTELTGTFKTTTSQLHRDAVILKSDVVVNTTTATFNSTVNGDGANNGDFGLTINDTAGTGSATTASFNGAVGTASGTSALDFLTVNATTINLNGGAVTTSADTAGTGNQVYNGAVLIDTTGNTTTLTGVNITFQSTVRSATDAEEALVVSGTGITTFNGAVGDNSQRLLTLTANNGGSTVVNGGSVTTSSTQLYNDAVTIGSGAGATTTFTSGSTAGNLGVHFANTLDGDAANDANANVIINTQGITRFDGIVGNTVGNASITSLTTDAGGETHINPSGAVSGSAGAPNIWTLNNQTYNDDVKLSVDLAANNGLDVYLRAEAGATIAFGPRVDGRDNFEQGLTVFADSVSITTTQVGILVPLEFLDISAGPSGITTSSLTQNTEIQFLVGTAILGIVEANGFNLTITANDINFVGGAGSIRPGAPLGGAGTVGPSLTLRPISTVVPMNIGPSADVPGTFSLSDADLLALADGFGGITIGRFDGANPITVSSSNFTDPVRIQAPLAGGTMLIDGLVQSTATPQEALLARDLFLSDIDAANNPVFINSYVLGEGGNITGSAGTPLPNGAGILLFGPGSTVTMNANIQTAGTPIVINDGVILNTDVSLNTTFNGVAAGNDITITGTINSAALNNFGITLRGGTGGNIDIQNTVGNAQAVSDIIIPNANNVDFDNTVNITGAITITTANDVIFRNTVVAGGAISIASANNVNFENTVAAGSVTQAAGTGVTLFRDNVTTTTATGVNITSAGITLDGLTINSTAGNGAIRFNGPVTLSTADVTLSSGTGNITFESTVNGGVNLALNSTGITTFNGLVGTGTALTSVTTDAGGTTVINGAGVTTTADQLYNDNVTLGVAAVTLNGVNVTFNGTVNGPAALTVNASGVTTFGDAAGDSVGAGTALLSLTTDAAGSTTVNAAIVTTSGAQVYNDAVTFNTDVNFTGSTVTFNQALAGGANNLTVTGNAVFGDAAADSVNTGAILVTGNTTVNGATVNTGAESQTYNGDVTLGTDVNFTGSTVQFDEDVLGTPNNLTITGSAIFGSASNDAVNTGAILVTGATLVNSGTVTTTGETQTYTGNVGLGSSVNFTGTTVTFLEDVIGGANNLTVTGDAAFGDAADDIIGANQVLVTGATTITAGAVNTVAGQTYTGAVTLGSSTTLTAGGNLLLSSTLVGNFDLTLAITGSSTFTGAVGGAAAGTAIGDGTGAAIIINSTGATEFQSTVNTASGIFQAGAAGAVTFLDNVTIAAGDTASSFNANVILDGLTLTSAGAVSFGDAATDTVTLSGGPVTFVVTGLTTVNSIVNGNQDLTLNSAGDTAFNAAVGGTLAATEIGDGTDASIIFTGTGAVTFNGTVRTKTGFLQDNAAGLVTFRENVTVSDGDTASIFNGNVVLDGLIFDSARGATFGNAATDTVALSGSDVTLVIDETTTFNAVVDGNVDLVINSLGATIFNAAVGSTTQVGDGTGASIAIGANAGAVTFNSTVRTATGITQDGTAGLLTFVDNVNILGAGTATILSGDVTLDGLTFTSAGAVTFGDAGTDTLTLSTGDVTLAVAGTTTVNSATDGAVDLILNSGGSTAFNAPVGFNTAIGDGAGASISLTGAGAVTFNSTVRTATGISQAGGAGLLTFADNVNVLGAGTATTLNGNVTLDGMTFTSVGVITIGDAAGDTLTLSSGDVTITSTGAGAAGNVTFNATITGAQNLVVNTAGTTAFNAPVGTPTALLSLTTDAPGATTIGAAITTTAAQTFNDPVTLTANAVLTAGTDVNFNSTLNGTFNLTVTAAGVTRFNGTVGNTDDLAILIVNGGGTAVINTPQIDAAAVQFDDAVILAADTTVTGTSSIRFNSTITGANFDLTTVGGAAFTQFNGDVTGVDVLNTTGTGATFINTALISGNVLNFDDAIGIDAANVLLVGQTSVDFALTIGSTGLGGAEAGNNLTINSPVVGFHGAVSPSGALADLLGTLTVDGTTAGAGTTTIDIGAAGGNGNHIAANIINFNQGVVVDQSAAVLGVTSVSFNSIVNSAASEANNLTVNSPVTLFAGVVGGAVNGALGTLSTDAAGTTTIDTTAITAAVVDFNDAIVLNQSVVVTGTTSVDFLSTINSQAAEANSLTVNSPITGFHGIIGALVPLGTLSTDAAGTTTLDTTAITAAVVDFNDAVLVDQNLTINGTTSIDFAGTLDSQAAENNDLTLNSPVTGFHGIVGGTRPLGTLNTDAAGTTTLDTTAISVAVADFNDAVVVDQNLTIIGTTSIDFAGTLNSQVLENNNLTLNSPTTAFHGIVGAASPFGTLSTDAAGTTTIDTTAVTAANVDFNDAILLTQDVVINGTATIDFASTVNSSGAARDLTLNSPSTAFHGIVGGTLALDVLSTDAAGTTTIDTTAISAAVVDFNDAIVLSQDVVINGSTSIDFASTVNSSGGARDLTLNSPVTGFHGVVGGSAVLDVLTTDAAGTTTIDTTAINAAVIDFNDAIIIDVGTVLTGTTSVDFALTVNSQVGEANDLTVNSPVTGFHGIVGGTTALNTLTTDAAGTTTIDTTAITADVADFNDAILLSQDVVITGTTSVDFASTVNSSGAARDLTVNSPTTAFHGIVGGTSPLDVLTTDAAGTTTIDTTAITGATLDFNDAVTLSQNVVLTGTTTVDFATTVNSDLIATPRTLLVVSPLTIFGGSVGGAVPLASLTTDASGGANLTRINGGSVTTTGDQTYNDTVRLGADTILTGNDITFATLLDSSEGALRSLTVNSTGGGITTFNGAVGTLDRLAHLETNADGRTDIAGGLINLNGASALFNDPVLLLADLTINEAGVGSVTFNNTLNGAFNLVVNSDGLGATIFNGVVGGVTPLASITTDADGTTQINGGIVNTSGFQLYNDPVTIGANTVLTSTGVGAAGNITFVTTLDGPFTLLVNTAGTTTFGGPVGSITPLNSVTTDAPGATAINGGSVLTFGTQTYNDPVTLGANTIITSTGAAALGNVTFNSTLDSAVGPFSLVVNTAGNTDFNGAVGAVGALLSLTTDAPGTVSIDGGVVTTTTFQLYNDVATIGANTVLTSTGAGNITFMQTLDGAFTLNVNTAGITIFNGVVGGITPLVSVVTDAAGSTQVNGTAVTTSGIQTYNDPVTVGANTLFTSTGVGALGNITFNSTLDDDAVVGAANVTVNTAGATTFNGAVGGITPLTSLTTDAAGNVAINGGLVTTVNNQTYNDVATLGADTVLNSLAAGNITFAQTLDDDLTIPANTSNLIVNTSGVTTFGGVVGGISPLTSITTDPAVGVVGAGDITAINGGLVITTGFQTYNDNVTVNQDTTLTSTTVGNITIGQPNPPVPWGLTTLMGTVPGVDMIINALGGNVQINAAVSGVDTLNGIATATYIAANPGNTGINLYLSTPNSPFVFIYTAPPVSFNLNNKVYSMEEIFGRDVPNLFKYPGDDKSVSSEITVLLTTNKVETLIGSLPTDKITTSYDLAALEEARKNR